MDNRHYILDGKIPVPVDLLTWGRWLEEHSQERIVAQEDVGEFWVSTVFLGLDHNFFDKGPPLLFETMVFKGYTYSEISGRNIKDCTDYADRYSTWELALEGHRKACQWAREQLT